MGIHIQLIGVNCFSIIYVAMHLCTPNTYNIVQLVYCTKGI